MKICQSRFKARVSMSICYYLVDARTGMKLAESMCSSDMIDMRKELGFYNQSSGDGEGDGEED